MFMAGYLIDAGAAELISQEAAWATTLLLGRVGIACARHALTLWAVARPRCRGCHVARHATEAVTASVDTCDGQLGGVAGHRAAL